MADQSLVVRRKSTEVFIDGDEAVRMYFRTPELNFSVGALPPGHKTPMDPGHSRAMEVAFVVEGEVVFELKEPANMTEWLSAGDAILIQPGVPHLVYNAGTTVARVAWALSPGSSVPVRSPRGEKALRAKKKG
jgi:quercetin dioxygenase-like cupin family protein